jgi:hypothetical protein
MSKSLGEIGPRGLLVHCGDDDGSGYKYYEDNKDVSWRVFEVDAGQVAKETETTPDELAFLVNKRAPVAALSTSSFLINLNAFHGLPRLAGEPPTGKLGTESDISKGLFLMHEDGKYYAIPVTALKPLGPLDEGDAQVIIKRGTVAAAIPPNDLPIGTHCVLLNLTQLMPSYQFP